jgi:hypothetical protein
MTIKETIQEIIENHPKHFNRMIKNNPIYWEWVLEHSQVSILNTSAQIYSAVHNTSGICTKGNQQKFDSIKNGFKFCGTTANCQCAKESVSQKVIKAKASRTKEQIEQENKKRAITSLERYNVTNNGQTPKALLNHLMCYKDQEKVKSINEKIKNTKLVNHGSKSFNNRKQAIATNLKKYGVENTWMLTEHKQNPNLQLLKNIDYIKTIFPKFTVEEIADQLNVHPQTVYYYLGMHGLREPYKSTFEQEIVSFLKEHGIEKIITNSRSIIGKEIDVYLPEFDLAIEYNGEYWHHDAIPHINKTYHYEKFKDCENRQITLFTIFGNSWKHKKDIWKNKILAKLGKAPKVFARKTQLVELSPKETKTFLDQNHVQGYCVSQIGYGLVEDNMLVAVMTFSKNRSGIGKKRSDTDYELVRYASSKTVVGGASKLLKHFIKMHSPTNIVSYSDNQYSIGALYKQLGFLLEHENKAGYWYFNPATKKQYHRYQFTKHKLIKDGFDPDKTEAQIMKERGFLKIWDCGSRTWVLSCCIDK